MSNNGRIQKRLERILRLKAGNFLEDAGVIQYTPGQSLGQNGLCHSWVELFDHHTQACDVQERQNNCGLETRVRSAMNLIRHARRTHLHTKRTLEPRGKSEMNVRNMRLDYFFLLDGLVLMTLDAIDWLDSAADFSRKGKRNQRDASYMAERKTYVRRRLLEYQLDQLTESDYIVKHLTPERARVDILQRTADNVMSSINMLNGDGVYAGGAILGYACRNVRQLTILLPEGEQRNRMLRQGLAYREAATRLDGLTKEGAIDLCYFSCGIARSDYELKREIDLDAMTCFVSAAKAAVRLLHDAYQQSTQEDYELLNLASHALLHSFASMHRHIQRMRSDMDEDSINRVWAEAGMNIPREMRWIYARLLPVAGEVTPRRYYVTLTEPLFVY